MTTSLKRQSLSKPEKGKQIPAHTLSFVRARNKNKAHSLLLSLFVESGMTKKDLAVMLNKKPEQITRWLGGPGNITFDTLSDLIFAITSKFVEVCPEDELSKGKSNCRAPSWFTTISTGSESFCVQARTPKTGHAVVKSDWKNSSSAKERCYEFGDGKTNYESYARV